MGASCHEPLAPFDARRRRRTRQTPRRGIGRGFRRPSPRTSPGGRAIPSAGRPRDRAAELAPPGPSPIRRRSDWLAVRPGGARCRARTRPGSGGARPPRPRRARGLEAPPRRRSTPGPGSRHSTGPSWRCAWRTGPRRRTRRGRGHEGCRCRGFPPRPGPWHRSRCLPSYAAPSGVFDEESITSELFEKQQLKFGSPGYPPAASPSTERPAMLAPSACEARIGPLECPESADRHLPRGAGATARGAGTGSAQMRSGDRGGGPSPPRSAAPHESAVGVVA